MSESIIVPAWPAPPQVHAAVTTRVVPSASHAPYDLFNLGAHCSDAAHDVQANRAMLESLLDLPSAPRWLHQVHATTVKIFDAAAAPDEEPPNADAAIARTPGTVLAVLSADCLPLLVCADDGGEIAAIHAGWRGLASGVIERCIEALQTPRERLLVWLGPAIGPRSYEVGSELRDIFVARDPADAQAFVASRPGHWLCDLYTLARRRLTALGVARVYGGGLDTFADSRFYSYRREGTTGRIASLIWLR
jgi:YfiH family protein